MFKKYAVLTLSLLLAGQSTTYACSRGTAIIGTLAVGAVSAIPSYITYSEIAADSKKYARVRFYEDYRSGNFAKYTALSLAATAGTWLVLRRFTPQFRLNKAASLLSTVDADGLKNLHRLYKTKQFEPAIQERYVMHSQTYAGAFNEFKETRSTALDAIKLIDKARHTAKNRALGEDLFREAQQFSEIGRDLILEIKTFPEFQKQLSSYQKLQNQKKIADELEDIATYQAIQTMNSFSRK
jgi:hypothetical protein